MKTTKKTLTKEKKNHTENSRNLILESIHRVIKMESKRYGFYEKSILRGKQANAKQTN